MCQKCTISGCKRDILQNIKSTAFSLLRRDEKVLVRSRLKSIEQVAEKLVSLGFCGTMWVGENCCDFQAVKRYNKGCYHYRTYDYTRKIMLESHIDVVDPSQDPVNHIGEVIFHRLGVEKDSNHHFIVFKK